VTDPDSIAEERHRLRILKTVVDLTANVLAQSRPPRPEAEALVAAARRQALALFPDKESVFDLVLAPRFRRLIDEYSPTLTSASSRSWPSSEPS
jgi:hypothetical protein